MSASHNIIDPLDPTEAPFGAFAPPSWLSALRAASLSLQAGRPFEGVAYRLLSQLTARRGLVVDLIYRGMKRRLFIDEFAHDKWVFRKGRHAEEEELDTISAHAGEDLVFIDIGANNGYFAIYAAQQLGPKARVLAVEPHPRTFRKLSLHIALNDAARVEAVNVALGAEEGRLDLRLSRDDGSHTLHPGGAADGAPSVDVAVRPLASLLADKGIDRVDLLKIDVEGFEDAVLGPFFASAPEALWPAEMMIETAHRDERWGFDLIERVLSLGYQIQKQNADNAWLTRARTN